MDKANELQQELAYFDKARAVIQENIQGYEAEYEKRHQEAVELFRAMQGGNVEVYNQLMTTKSMEEHSANQLRKNKAAYAKPYFGRIDYLDEEAQKEEIIYIGKNGVFLNKTEVIIADWRAPVSSVYYENELGKGSYSLITANDAQIDIDIRLHLKRTFDIAEDKLQGYYDSDVASNDELLIQYLSQNKDAVLGEIIATIQKEQNEIIRESPFASQVVQGVAGSGKTTVAMHRISYILYNYKERFESNEFCVVGGNDLLLNYITSGLPELDVYHMKKKRMDELLIHLIGREWKKKNQIVDVFADAGYRSQIPFYCELEEFLAGKRTAYVDRTGVKDERLGTLLTESSNNALVEEYPGFSAAKLLMMMDDRIRTRIKSLLGHEEKEVIQSKLKEYRNCKLDKFPKTSIYTLYDEFYCSFLANNEQAAAEAAAHLQAMQKGKYDIYDAAALLLIEYRMFRKQEDEEFGQLFVDEAQDFGSGIYYVLKKVLPKCYFTIMGDVSQNMNYDTGMNDWELLKEYVLTGPRDCFRLLSKSYRNTIEISEFAGKILEKASTGEYKIDPVIRHGKPVERMTFWSETELLDKTVSVIQESRDSGFHSIAVICRDDAEAERVQRYLAPYTESGDGEADGFYQGIMVLPIRMTKGLEFDTVVLWNLETELTAMTTKQAKLLYIGVTRALHRLYVLNC